MKYRKFRDTGIETSILGMGCMRLPTKPGTRDVDYAKAEEIIDYAYANGINYYDTAYVYNDGDSERCTGKALSKYPRDSYMLATKLPMGMPGLKYTCPQDVIDIFNIQRERCGVEYFDFYLCHNINESTIDSFKVDFLIPTLLELKEQGLIRYLGFSSHGSPEILEDFASLRDWDFAQIQLNYLDWTYQDAKQQYEILTRRGIPVIVMEPVRGGRLADLGDPHNGLLRARSPEASIASWALRYVADFPNVQVVLSGMSTMDQIIDNIKTMSAGKPLSGEEREMLEGIARAILGDNLLPCTACHYCTDTCPVGLDIPDLIEILNDYSLSKDAFALMPLDRMPAEKNPENCIKCSECVSHCPQKIEIPDALERLVAESAACPRPNRT